MAKNWKIEINTDRPGSSRVYYKSDLVGLLTHVDVSVDVKEALPAVNFTVLTRDVEVVTVSGEGKPNGQE